MFMNLNTVVESLDEKFETWWSQHILQYKPVHYQKYGYIKVWFFNINSIIEERKHHTIECSFLEIYKMRHMVIFFIDAHMTELTHWIWNKMADIVQTTFSNVFFDKAIGHYLNQ